MRIENDTEVYEPSECFFAADADPDNPNGSMVSITSMAYWKERGCLDDCFGDHSLTEKAVEQMMGAGLFNAMEAVWTSEAPPEQVTAFMQKLGFVEEPKMHFTDLLY